MEELSSVVAFSGAAESIRLHGGRWEETVEVPPAVVSTLESPRVGVE